MGDKIFIKQKQLRGLPSEVTAEVERWRREVMSDVSPDVFRATISHTFLGAIQALVDSVDGNGVIDVERVRELVRKQAGDYYFSDARFDKAVRDLSDGTWNDH